MKNDHLISVIVPVYNAEKYLDVCLDSIINQTYKNLEIILIDDGATDKSGSICDEYAKKDPRIKVIHKQNEGVSKARNTALDMISGEYVGFVDSDDTIKNEMYELLLSNIIANDSDIAICRQSEIVGEHQSIIETVERTTYFTKDESIEQVLLGKAFRGGPCNKLFKASMCETLRFDTDIAYGEDLLFVVKYLLKCKKIVCIPDVCYDYCIRDDSACTGKFTEKTFTDHISRERVLCELEKTNNQELIELGHTAFLLCDIGLLGKLYYEKDERRKYCKKLQKSIRAHFSFNRIKKVSLFQKIGILSAYISINLYFLLFPVQIKIKEIKGVQ